MFRIVSIRRCPTTQSNSSTHPLPGMFPAVSTKPSLVSVTKQIGRLILAPFEYYDSNAQAVRGPKTYTESCHGAPMMTSHLGFKSSVRPVRRGEGQAPIRTTVVERLYDHPPEVSPRDLTCMHINKMYCMSNEDLRRTFPEGLGGKVSQLFVPGHPRGFLYRKTSHLLNVYTNKMLEQKESVLQTLRNGLAGILLHGPSGTGKSALVCQAVHYARSKNILTFYIPNARHYTHGEWAWPSVIVPGYFDAPDAARSTLMYFSRAHASILSKLPLKVTPLDLPIDSTEREVKTIFDLCDWAVRAPAPTSVDRQSVAMKYLLDELRALKDIPVLYAIDGMNLFSLHTHYRYPHPDYLRNFSSFEEVNSDMDIYVKEMPRIPSSRLVLTRELNKTMCDIVEGVVKNQSFITCSDMWMKDPINTPAFDNCATTNPNFGALDEYTPFYPEEDTILHPMNVTDFDEYEYRSFFRFLINSGELAGLGWGPLWHHSSDFERKLYKVDFMSDRNPQRVINHYHQEFLWRLEYQRLRQKQSFQENGKP